VTASGELEPCRKWNVQYMPVFGPQQPLPGEFQSNHVTPGSLLLTWGNVTSFPVTRLPPPASYSLVGGECTVYVSFRHFKPPPGDFRSNDDTFGALSVTLSHVTLFPVTWLPPPASYNLAESEMYSICQFSALYSHFQVTSGQMMSLPHHFWLREVTWRHFLPRDCLLRRARAL